MLNQTLISRGRWRPRGNALLMARQPSVGRAFGWLASAVFWSWVENKLRFPWPFSKRKTKCACTLGSRAPATFSESAELSCACPSSVTKSSLSQLDMSHDRTADQSHEYLGCNDFFGQGIICCSFYLWYAFHWPFPLVILLTSRHDNGFSGLFWVFVFGRLELLYRDFDKVSDSLDLSKSDRTF